jgi:hypothetical protein
MGACGEWAWWHPEKGYSRFFCGSGNCHRPECRVKFWSHRVRLITALIGEYELYRFFTLTLDPRNIPPGEDPWVYVHHPWSKMRKRLKRLFPNFRFVAVLERHKKRNVPHIHGFCNVWLHKSVWRKLWIECKGGWVTWIERVWDKADATDYVTKQLEVAKYIGKDNLVPTYSVQENKRFRTLWRSENTRAKFELTNESEWCIIKEAIYREDGELTDWAARKGVWAYGEEKQIRQDVEATCSALPT